MAFDIEGARFYKRELRIADANKSEDGYNGKIDSIKELDRALRYIIAGKSIGDFPEKMQVALRKFVDSQSEGEDQYNGKIDSAELQIAIDVLVKQFNTKQAVLDELVYGGSSSGARSASVVDVKKVLPLACAPDFPANGEFTASMNKLVGFMLSNDGNPPNMVRSFKSEGKDSLAVYHVFEDDSTHLRNGGATTSEGQELFFNFMVLNAAINGNKAPMEGAYNYLKMYMMPHDGEGSVQLPDDKLELPNARHNPYLVQWLVDVSGNSKSGDAVFGENTAYKIYDPGFEPFASVAQTKNLSPDQFPNNETLPDVRSKLTGDNNTFKFGCATDADQWIQSGFYWAKQFGVASYDKDLSLFNKYLKLVLTPKTNKYPNVMMFGYYWGGNTQENWGWSDIGKDVYSGYQDPAAWFVMGDKEIATDIVSFLDDAQSEYDKRYDVSGPFMPVYNKDGFGWNGPDPNTHWMGFQYRTFSHLAQYYYLSGDKKAEEMLEKFISWVETNSASDSKGQIIPVSLNSGRSDGEGVSHVNGKIGSVEEKGFAPDCHGLYAQGLTMYAAKTKNSADKAKAHKILKTLQNRQSNAGNYESAGKTYGFHQSEVGIAFALYQLYLEAQ